MSHQVKLERQAFNQLERLGDPQRTRIVNAILALEHDPFPPGKKWKRLEGTRGLVRLRTGDYRVIYEVLSDEVHVLAVIHRRDLERLLRAIAR